MPNFEIGLSALRASQFALDVVSNNIANANTPGYHRRRVLEVTAQPNETLGIRIGAGVKVSRVQRIRDDILENSLNDVLSDVSNVDQLLVIERQIEDTLLRGNGSTIEELDLLFGRLTELSSSPGEPAQRSAVIETASRLSNLLRDSSNQLADLTSSVEVQIASELTVLNDQMERLSELNVEIRILTSSGRNANSELDDRDALLAEITKTVGATRADTPSGELNLIIGSAAIHQSSSLNVFSTQENENGEIEFFLNGTDKPIKLKSGRLAALQESANTLIPKYQDKLDHFAGELIRLFDSAHATGVGPAGSFGILTGNRTVQSIDTPLSDTNLAFPVSAGDLTITITDDAGNRRHETIAIDPEVDTLQDLANRLDAVDGLSTSIAAKDNRLSIFADQDLKFDFTGNLETTPDLSGFTGTSVPTLSGQFEGVTNQNITFEINGSGDVGISDDLSVNLYDENSNLIRTVSIGRGYEAGTPIDLDEGVKIAFSHGSVVGGETFETDFLATPDETGILAALGLNSFFAGSSASDIQVASQILLDSDRFATGKTSDASDTLNLFSLTDIQSKSISSGDQTLTQFINEVTAEIGFDINSDVAVSTSLTTMQLRLEQDRDSHSGIDLNEEIVYMQQYQRSYEAAARLLQAADEMLSTLFSILR